MNLSITVLPLGEYWILTAALSGATYQGGVLHSTSSTITIGGSIFTINSSPMGAVICSLSGSKIQHHSYLLIDNNWTDRYAVIYLSELELRGHNSANVTLSNNFGSLMAFNNNITFMGYAKLVNNQPQQTTTGDFQEGGAITLFQSNVIFDGSCRLEHNHAENGGAIHSTEGKLYVTGSAHNTATRNGGGIYLLNSELNYQQKSTIVLFNNTVVHKGGGLHATSSSIKATSTYKYKHYSGTRINFKKNAAKRGGGLSLEANAKVNILKHDLIIPAIFYDTDTTTFIFTVNEADYGGAVYVDDDTNSGTCASETNTECFFQNLAVHSRESEYFKTQSISFSKNYANISGSTLFGGLLHRCAVSYFAEDYRKYTEAMELLTLRVFWLLQTYQYRLFQSKCAFASMDYTTAPMEVMSRLKREKISQCHLLLLIRLANQLMQSSKPPSTSLRVV